MSAFFWYVFSPGGVVVAFTIGAVAVLARRGWARRFIAVTATFYLLSSVFAVSAALDRPLLAGLHPLQRADVPPGRIAVAVLGSGSVTVRGWDGSQYATPDPLAAERVLEGFRVFTLIQPEWVLTTGGSLDTNSDKVPPGQISSDALVALGVPATRIVVDLRPHTTHEEAVVVAERLRSLNADHLVVVTSARHMKRALGAFRAEGVAAIPAIARDSVSVVRIRDRWLPSTMGLWQMSMVSHEFLGLSAYYLRGWYR